MLGRILVLEHSNAIICASRLFLVGLFFVLIEKLKLLIMEGIHNSNPLSLLRYYVGVLNKRTMTMEVHRAQLFRMQPVIPGKRKTVSSIIGIQILNR